jgi:tRNA G18 (ribose-2'-O)-methylase SpoU
MEDREKQLKFQDLRPDAAQREQDIQTRRSPIALLSDGITDPKNLGLLFRLADAARMEHLYLWNTPLEEPGKKTARISRSTVQYVPHSHLSSPAELDALKGRYHCLALEYTQRSVAYTDCQPPFPVLLVVGNEQSGVSDQLLRWCHQSIHLPMLGMNTSMNVSFATAIAVYDLLNKSSFKAE